MNAREWCPVCGCYHGGNTMAQAAGYVYDCYQRRRAHYERTGEVWPLYEPNDEIPMDGFGDGPELAPFDGPENYAIQPAA